MRFIPLTRGMFAAVDNEDFEELNNHKWHALKVGRRFYAARTVSRPGRNGSSMILMHRVITNAAAGLDVDHKDGDGLNNTQINLRVVNRVTNLRGHSRKRLNTSSEYRGVYWYKRHRKWHARIYDGRCIHLSYFTEEVEAAKAFDAKARELGWPEEGLNFPKV